MCDLCPQFEFTPEERALIDGARAEDGKTWYSKTIADLKTRLKKYYRENVISECCYCRRSFQGEFSLDIDIEHILPQSVFEEFMFEPMNLSLACKRCNMLIKRADVSFITNIPLVRTAPFDGQYYLLIHPNIDPYYDHLGKRTLMVDGVGVNKYITKNHSPKGEYTYKYFRLKELEIDDMTVAQGGTPELVSSEMVPESIREQLIKLNDHFNK